MRRDGLLQRLGLWSISFLLITFIPWVPVKAADFPSDTGLQVTTRTSSGAYIDSSLTLFSSATSSFLKPPYDYLISGGSGSYTVNIPTGSYSVYGSSSAGFAYYPVCGVSTGQIATGCDLTYGNNFHFSLMDSSNNVVSLKTASIKVELLGEPVHKYGSTIYPTFEQTSDGTLGLIDGNYRITVWTHGQEIGLGTIFTLTVDSGAISITRTSDSLAITNSGSGFILPLLDDNFSGQEMAGSNSVPNAQVNFNTWDRITGAYSGFHAFTDSEGKFSVRLPDGTFQVYVYNNGLDPTQFINSFYTLVIEKGVVISLKNSTGDLIPANPDTQLYPLSLVQANINGTLTIDGVAASGYISQVFDLLSNKSISFSASYIDSNGHFGVYLPQGKYSLIIVPTNSPAIAISCSVSNTGSNTCNAALPARNFTLELDDQNGQILPDNHGNAWFTVDALSLMSFSSNVPINSTNKTFYLADGNYVLNISSNSPNVDGQPRQFRFSVNHGTASDLTDIQTGQSIAISSDGIYHVKLLAPNFNVHVYANGSIDPGVNLNTSQFGKDSTISRNGRSDDLGLVKLSLPDGLNLVQLTPNRTETPTVVGITYNVQVSNGNVVSVSKPSGETITALADGSYKLDLAVPNLIGNVTVNGQATDGYIAGVWNTVSNQSISSYSDNWNQFTGQYATVLPAGNYDFMFVPRANGLVGGVQNCNVYADRQSQCNVLFPADNLFINVGRASNPSESITSGIYTDLRIIPSPKQATFPPWWSFNIPTNSAGELHTSLLDGNYQITVGSSKPSSDGTSRTFTFTVSSGVVSPLTDTLTNARITSSGTEFNIPLAIPNLKGKILDANGVGDPRAYGWIWNQNGRSSSISFNADSDGSIVSRLTDGTYSMVVYPSGNESPNVLQGDFTFTVTNDSITSFVDSDGLSVPFQGDQFNLSLKSPNISGNIFLGSESAQGTPFWINGFYDLNTQNWSNYQSGPNGWLVQGNYYARAANSKYLVALNEYGKGTVFLPCDASASPAICDLHMPLDNFKFKVQSPDGTDLFDSVGASGTVFMDNTASGFWAQMGSNGTFSSPIQIPEGHTGYYLFNVYNTDGSNRHGVPSVYRVDMDSVTGEITVKDQSTNIPAVLGSDGIYRLKLSAPNINGTVVGPDGSSPVANVPVQVFGMYGGVGMTTDTSGAFSTRFNVDGSYSIFAQPPTFDPSKAESSRTNFTLTNGGNDHPNMTLVLHTPNVVGLVSGPNGPSSQNYIQVLKDDGDGNYNFVGLDVAMSRPSDSSGKFAFYLDPGNYKFRGQSDFAGAGGGTALSDVCTVPSTVVTDVKNATVCNIKLSPLNTLLKFVGQNGKPYTTANIWFSYQGVIDKSAVSSKLTWDYAMTDQLGITRNHLDDGTWNAHVEPWGSGSEGPLDLVITVEGGAVQSVASNKGVTFTKDGDGFYSVNLPSYNLVGSITFNGKQINYPAVVYLMQQTSSGLQWVNSRWMASGSFGFTADPGTYTIQVVPYYYGAFSSGAPVSTKIVDCVVADSGVTHCDVPLRTGNLQGNITSTSGALVTDASAYVIRTDTDPKTMFTKYLDTQFNVYAGQFSVFLDTGEYNLVVNPSWNSAGSISSTYHIVVNAQNANPIVSVTNLLTNLPVNPRSDGRYNFALGKPTVSGTVYSSSGSTAVVPYSTVVPMIADQYMWDSAVSTNMNGQYSIALPDGTFDLVAISNGYGKSLGFSRSIHRTVTVSGGELIGSANPIDLRMQDPNFFFKVVAPGTSAGLPNVYVKGFYGDQYFGGMTDTQGNFQGFIDTTNATTCPSTCQFILIPMNDSRYTWKTYTFSTPQNLGELEIGKINTTVNVQIPVNGTTGLPNKWSWINVSELNETGTVVNQSGYGTNSVGQVGLDLTSGKHYQITAYPSGDYYDRYSPKTIDIPSFNPSDSSTITITFDSPNITFIILDKNGEMNSWGYYQIFKKSGSDFVQFGESNLNTNGRGAQYLPDGDYKIDFYPGKAIGVMKEVSFTVSGGHASTSPAPSGIAFSNDVGQVTLTNGNVSGDVLLNASIPQANIAITAKTLEGESKTVTTVSQQDGTFTLDLDTAHSWSVSATNPLTSEIVTSTIPLGATYPYVIDLYFSS